MPNSLSLFISLALLLFTVNNYFLVFSPHHNFTAPPPYTAKTFTAPIQRPSVPQQQPPTPPPQPPSPVAAAAAPIPAKLPIGVDTTVSLASPLLVNLLQTDKEGKDAREAEPRPSKPRPRPLTKPFPPRAVPPRFPLPTQRLPPAASSSAIPAATVVSGPAKLTRPAAPAFTVGKDAAQPRSVLQGYSQFTGTCALFNFTQHWCC